MSALPVFGAARTIALFASIGSEVETAGLEAAARGHNASTCYPRVQGGRLSFYAASRDELSPEGRWKIPSPPDDPERGVDPLAIDLFIVPGVAFDAAHRRLGYGRGYYDRVLAAAPRAAKIAVAFEAQIVGEVPVGSHDVTVDAVVTESRVL